MPHGSTRRASGAELSAVAAFLRGLAERVEGDPQFGREVAALLAESGLLGDTPGRRVAASGGRARRTGSGKAAVAARDGGDASVAAAVPDPFTLLREQGEEGLRARLAALELGELRQLVRQHRIDPARISARWTNRERVVDLIVAQVRARLDHGKAFARV